jgi:signal transduction histidine kinase
MRFKQVLLNLFSNAIKFSRREGSIEITCTKSPDNLLLVEVRDTGYGIRSEDIPKLFKLFGFLESTRSVNHNGIGLGLFITKKIVEEFGGSVGVVSQHG